MTLPLLQQLWVSGAHRCLCNSTSITHLLSQAGPALHQAANSAASQVWFSSSNSTAGNAAPAAAAAPPAAASQQKKQKPRKEKQSSAAADAVAPAAKQADPEAADKQLQQLKQQYQSCRMQDYYNNHLSRELMLKLNVASVNQLPRIKSIDLSINANDTHGRRYAEKWEMLLPALALEYITGKPATYVHSTLKYYRSRNAVTAVKVHLVGRETLDFLQKLIYIVLPSQNAFSGISSRSLDAAGNLHFRLPKIINFPDFEEQFEIFENLQSLHVSVNLANTQGHKGRSQLLMTGLQLPMLARKGEVAEGEPDQPAAADDGAADLPLEASEYDAEGPDAADS